MKVEFKEFNSIIGKINGIYHEAALKMGMSDSERDILYVLCDKGSGCNQSVLYKETGMTRSTVNSAIRKLENKGILYLTAGTGRNTCGAWEIIQRGRDCGEMKNSQMSEDDSPLKILAVASKPLAFPPFPLERIEELTKIMGGCGDVGGYYHEQRK